MKNLIPRVSIDHIDDTFIRTESSGKQIIFECPDCGGKATYNTELNIARCFTCEHPDEIKNSLLHYNQQKQGENMSKQIIKNSCYYTKEHYEFPDLTPNEKKTLILL
jgi:hypothetical protein